MSNQYAKRLVATLPSVNGGSDDDREATLYAVTEQLFADPSVGGCVEWEESVNRVLDLWNGTKCKPPYAKNQLATAVLDSWQARQNECDRQQRAAFDAFMASKAVPAANDAAPNGAPEAEIPSGSATGQQGRPSAACPDSIRLGLYGYKVESGRLCRVFRAEGETITEPLCTFVAHISDEVVCDNGQESNTVRVVVGEALDTGGNRRQLPALRVPATDFDDLRWVSQWGAAAVVLAGRGAREHARAAIQLYSGTPPRKTVYTHTGWRKLGDGWAYLHAGGAIGADGPVAGVSVELPEPLANFELPLPPAGDELVAAVRASLRVADIGPDHVTLPVLAATYRAAIDDADLSMFFVGPTGVFKSEEAALHQQHYGPRMDARHLPANWSSTANANEELAFHAMHTLLVVDDFAPGGALADVQRLHRDADRLLRAAGNRSGRGRARPDGSLRPAHPPRALILNTGEDVPKGHSIRARSVIAEIAAGDIDADKLTACQADAAAGLYAASMAGFVKWLAGRRDEVVKELRAKVVSLRDAAAGEGQHRRTPMNAASLLAGWTVFVRFAEQTGAVTDTEAARLIERAEAAFRHLADQQARHQADADPVEQFIRLLSSAVASGAAHIATTDGAAPRRPERFGWRHVDVGTGAFQRDEWQPQGRRVGWTAGDDLYLEPEAAYAATAALASGQGVGGLVVSPTTLWKRLDERGLLVSKDTNRDTLKIRKRVEGRSLGVLHLHATVLGIGDRDGAEGADDDADGDEDGDRPGQRCSALQFSVTLPLDPAANG